MKRRPTFIQGVLVAAVFALLATIMIPALSVPFGLDTAIRVTALILTLGYLLDHFRTSSARTGRILTLSAWGLFSLCSWWFTPSLAVFLLLQAAALWLIRSLYAYSGLIPALGDAALSALAVMAFAWAFMRTGSVFLATWCFFLLQALWRFIPKQVQPPAATRQGAGSGDGFEQARRQADAALRHLYSK